MIRRLVVLGLVTLNLAATNQIGQDVPASLLTAASIPPYEFAMLLAEASIPSGLEVRRSDTRRPRRPDFEFDRQPTVSIAVLKDQFNAHHSEYRADLVDGVFAMRPTEYRATYLDQPSMLPLMHVTGVMAAARKIFSELDPRLGGDGGILGSSIGPATLDRGENVVITLDGEGRPRAGLLNQIVKQSPRTWIVITTDDRENTQVVSFGFLHRGGFSTHQTIDSSTTSIPR